MEIADPSTSRILAQIIVHVDAGSVQVDISLQTMSTRLAEETTTTSMTSEKMDRVREKYSGTSQSRSASIPDFHLSSTTLANSRKSSENKVTDMNESMKVFR